MALVVVGLVEGLQTPRFAVLGEESVYLLFCTFDV
jgi:hypothetical protein